MNKVVFWKPDVAKVKYISSPLPVSWQASTDTKCERLLNGPLPICLKNESKNPTYSEAFDTQTASKPNELSIKEIHPVLIEL